MKILDYGTLAVFIIALFALSFFWQCGFDLTVTIFGLVIAAISGVATYMQHKALDEIMDEEE